MHTLNPEVLVASEFFTVTFFISVAAIVAALIISIISSFSTHWDQLRTIAFGAAFFGFLGALIFGLGFLISGGSGMGSENIKGGPPKGMDSCDIVAYRYQGRIRTNRTEYITARAVSKAVGVPVGVYDSTGLGQEIPRDTGRQTVDVKYINDRGDIVDGTLYIDVHGDEPWKISLHDSDENIVKPVSASAGSKLRSLSHGSGDVDVMDSACVFAKNSTMRWWNMRLMKKQAEKIPDDTFKGIRIIDRDSDGLSYENLHYMIGKDERMRTGYIYIIDGHAYLVGNDTDDDAS